MTEFEKLDVRGLGRRLERLEDGWRGALVRALGIYSHGFQVLHGAMDARLAGSPGGLSRLADRVPPGDTSVHLPEAGRLAPTFSDRYRRLLGAVLPETESGLRGGLGAHYPSWVAFRNSAPQGLSQRAVFAQWSGRVLDPAQGSAVRRLFALSSLDPVSVARDAFEAFDHRVSHTGGDGRVRQVAAYRFGSPTTAEALFPLDGALIYFDSDAIAPTQTGALRRAGATGAGVLPGLPGGLLDPLARRLATARITLRGTVRARGVVPVQAAGWYDPATLSRAMRAGPCDEVWDGWSETGRWSTFFGPKGLLIRHVTHLVVGAGFQGDLTIRARLTTLERARIAAALGLREGVPGPLRVARGARPAGPGAVTDTSTGRGGIWPFTLGSGVAAMDAVLRFDPRDGLCLSLRQTPGTLHVWGVRVGSVTAPD